MKLEFRCIKCGCRKCIEKTALILEKDPGLKLEVGKYYVKICEDCGFAEFYLAKVVDKSIEEEKKAHEYIKKASKKATVQR